MKIFNATNSSVDLPWTGGRLNIPPRSFSVDFLGEVNLVKLIATTFTPEQIAILVCGPYELSMCAGATTTAVNYVVQTTDEVVKRFGIKLGEEKEEEPVLEKVPAEEDTTAPETEPAPEPVENEPKKKKSTKKSKK